MKAVVLAAGKGERLWPLTETRPKPLLPIANKPILQHTIEGLVGAGIRQIIVVTNYKAELIREAFGDGGSFNCEIEYVKQKTPRGTADAVLAAGELLAREDRFVVVYGDDYFESQAVKDFLNRAGENNDITLSSAEVDDASQFGLVETANNQVTRIQEKSPRHLSGKVNAGLYVMTRSILSAIKRTMRSRRGEFELTDSLKILIDRNETVRAHALGDRAWLGISYAWDLLEANQRAVNSEMPSSVRGTLEEGVHVDGPVVVEEGSLVKAGSRIEGPVHIGRNCEVGPNSYLRSYTTLGNHVKVGGACEVKNSIIMSKTKIPHLSYVGDSILGEECSLGAGTITANLRFDEAVVKSRVRGRLVSSGRKKLGAILGDKVRTGINVSIFPGVKIGSASWVGPGATVKKDLESSSRYE